MDKDRLKRLLKIMVEQAVKKQMRLLKSEILNEIQDILQEKEMIAEDVLIDKSDSVPPARKRRERAVKYSSDSVLNELLNGTSAFNSEEYDLGDNNSPVTVEPAIMPELEQIDEGLSIMTGANGEVIDTSKEAVQDVLDILSNTDFKAKLDALNESGNQFRESMTHG